MRPKTLKTGLIFLITRVKIHLETQQTEENENLNTAFHWTRLPESQLSSAISQQVVVIVPLSRVRISSHRKLQNTNLFESGIRQFISSIQLWPNGGWSCTAPGPEAEDLSPLLLLLSPEITPSNRLPLIHSMLIALSHNVINLLNLSASSSINGIQPSIGQYSLSQAQRQRVALRPLC